jgi:Rrf2 family protein
VHIPAKVDYSLRALLTLVGSETSQTAESLAEQQNLPHRFLAAVLSDLRRAGLVVAVRGADGGFRLARPAEEITLAMVIRAIDGPLADIRGVRPEATSYGGSAEHLQDIWIAVRASLRDVLENVTLAQVASGRLPAKIRRLNADPEAWLPH